MKKKLCIVLVAIVIISAIICVFAAATGKTRPEPEQLYYIFHSNYGLIKQTNCDTFYYLEKPVSVEKDGLTLTLDEAYYIADEKLVHIDLQLKKENSDDTFYENHSGKDTPVPIITIDRKKLKLHVSSKGMNEYKGDTYIFSGLYELNCQPKDSAEINVELDEVDLSFTFAQKKGSENKNKIAYFGEEKDGVSVFAVPDEYRGKQGFYFSVDSDNDKFETVNIIPYLLEENGKIYFENEEGKEKIEAKLVKIDYGKVYFAFPNTPLNKDMSNYKFSYSMSVGGTYTGIGEEITVNLKNDEYKSKEYILLNKYKVRFEDISIDKSVKPNQINIFTVLEDSKADKSEKSDHSPSLTIIEGESEDPLPPYMSKENNTFKFNSAAPKNTDEIKFRVGINNAEIVVNGSISLN